MRSRSMVIWVVSLALLGTSGKSQTEAPTAANEIRLRFEDSAVYKRGATVPLTSVLLKKRITKHTDGSGSLSAVLLLTNRQGFDCQSDPDMELASEAEFIVGISLYEPFQAKESPEETVLHQMLFREIGPAETDPPMSYRWEDNLAVIFRHGGGATAWYSLKKAQAKGALTISEKSGKRLLSFDFEDPTLRVGGMLAPTRCP